MWLEKDQFKIELAPEQGALMRRLRWRDPSGHWHDLLRLPFTEGDVSGEPRRFGLWPLVPFANRAFGAVMDDGVNRYHMPVNDPAMGATIHGFGWENAWVMTDKTPASLTMMHERKGEGEADPYHYHAEMTVSILNDAVRIDISVMNRSNLRLPYGLGLHPWFPASADTRLELRAEGELVLGEGYRAKGRKSFANGGPYAAGPVFRKPHEIAHSFLEWDGMANIITGSTGLGMTITASPSLRHPVVWAPAEADFLCIEPQSHSLGAPSEKSAREATPLAMLETGETLVGWMMISPRAL